eukprot:jgi/Mesen1/689/ME000109S_10915
MLSCRGMRRIVALKMFFHAVPCGCAGASWAFAAVGAIEAATANLTSRQVVVSEQQVIDCQRGGSTCAGGWPGYAFEYAAENTAKCYGGLASESDYPYTGTRSKRGCNLIAADRGQHGVAFWEQVDFQDVLGLLLALQRQPVVVHLETDQDSFINYSGTVGGSSFLPLALHASPDATLIECNLVPFQYRVHPRDASGVLAAFREHPEKYRQSRSHFSMGQCLSMEPMEELLTKPVAAADTPYWIIRNSWGPGWGDNGHMYLALTGGDGVCGMLSTPPSYPVVRVAESDPCGSGAMNPCGGGTCIPSGRTNKCRCPPRFAAVTNLDGSQTCAPARPCRFFLYNPCNMGTCVDVMGDGTYTCICPEGLGSGSRPDSSPTCISVPPNTPTYKYVVQRADTCYLIHTTFRLTLAQFLAQNKGLKCNALRVGTSVNVTAVASNLRCILLYPLDQGDMCASVEALFGFTESLEGLNPGLNCSQLFPGQQVCIQVLEDRSVELPTCKRWSAVEAEDTCSTSSDSPSLLRKYNLSLRSFFELNPGVYCSNFHPQQGFPLPCGKVCTQKPDSAGGPTCRRSYKLRRGDSCASIIYNKFQKSASLFQALDKQLSCSTGSLFVNQIICIP